MRPIHSDCARLRSLIRLSDQQAIAIRIVHTHFALLHVGRESDWGDANFFGDQLLPQAYEVVRVKVEQDCLLRRNHRLVRNGKHDLCASRLHEGPNRRSVLVAQSVHHIQPELCVELDGPIDVGNVNHRHQTGHHGRHDVPL